MGNTCSANASDTDLRTHEDAGAIPDIMSHKDEEIVKASGDVHILIVALDYNKTKHPLSCTQDGKNMMDLARQSSVKDVVSLFDEAATKRNVKQKIKQMGSRCKQGDHFVFYYAGHGSNMKDHDKDELDGQDEAYCLVDAAGSVASSNWLRDDDFCKVMTSSIPKGTNVLILSDCCHSGTIADFDHPQWEGYHAVSVSGCKDAQTSGDTGKGGIFTHSMLLAIQKLNESYASGYSVGTLFRAVVDRDNRIFHSEQDITIRASSAVDCNVAESMSWPFMPPTSYRAPWNDRAVRDLPTEDVDILPTWHITSDKEAEVTELGDRSLGRPDLHVLICALDYKKTKYPLTCTMDGRNIEELARQSSAKTILTLFDEEATATNVQMKIRQLGERIKPNDYFVFFYAGHGTTLMDQDGDEDDHQDEAFCFVDERGQLAAENFMRDDDFASIMTSSIPRGANILIISDCCHSGTIADFKHPQWRGHRAISMSGCTDAQTSGDTGRGGIFTHSLLMAVENLNKRQHQGFTVGTLFRATLEKDESVFHSPQDLTMQATPHTSYDAIAWPFLPSKSYRAPWSRWSRAAHAQSTPAPSPSSDPPMSDTPLPNLLTQSQSLDKPGKTKNSKLQEVPVVSKPCCSGCFGAV